jgi:hypothetical protein
MGCMLDDVQELALQMAWSCPGSCGDGVRIWLLVWLKQDGRLLVWLKRDGRKPGFSVATVAVADAEGCWGAGILTRVTDGFGAGQAFEPASRPRTRGRHVQVCAGRE